MRNVIFIIAFLACSMALPSSNLNIDWSKMKSKNVFIEPIAKTKPGGNLKIVRGEEAEPHSLPYQVAVILGGNNLCGGSLISPEWVLTAAHCTIDVSVVQLILGAHNISEIEDTQVVVTSRNIINHPNYDPILVRNDIALVKLPYPVTLTPAIQIVGLPPRSNSESFAGSTGVASGWGRYSDSSNSASQTLQRVDVEIITNAACQASFGSFVVESNICTSGAGGRGTCTGDSGGPLVVANVQVGVTSFGPIFCESEAPRGSARVSYYRDWINSTTGI